MSREPAESANAVQRAVGLRIREVRRSKGMTQKSVAAALRMLVPNYSRIEQGRMNLTLDTLVRIASALDVRVIDLFRTPRPQTVRRGRPKAAATRARSKVTRA